MGSGSRQFTDLSAQQRQQQLAACKQSKFLSEFDYAADSQGDVPEGSQGDGVGADSSGYSDSQSDSLSDADSASDSDGAAADAAASHSSGSLWSGSSGGGGSSSGDAGSADDSDVSFVAEGSRKRKQTGQGVPGLKRPRQQQVAAAAKAAHKAVRFADEDGKGLEAGDLQQQWKQQQQQKAAQHRSSSSSLKAGSSNAARSRSVLELGAVLPGEVSASLAGITAAAEAVLKLTCHGQPSYRGLVSRLALATGASGTHACRSSWDEGQTERQALGSLSSCCVPAACVRLLLLLLLVPRCPCCCRLAPT